MLRTSFTTLSSRRFAGCAAAATTTAFCCIDPRQQRVTAPCFANASACFSAVAANISAARRFLAPTMPVAYAGSSGTEDIFIRSGARDDDAAAAASEGAKFDYDLLVIGGGSGGIAAAKRAAGHGATVALCDFVTPAPNTGTTWGLGGVCANVGCIPKKLMHTSALIGETIAHSASAFGWGAEETPFSLGDAAAAPAEDGKAKADISKIPNKELVAFSWSRLQQNVHDYIRSSSFGYVTALRKANVKYINASASFVDAHTVKLVDKKGKETVVRARRFLIATGGRPTALAVPGGEHAITSDDLFWSKAAANPGKTLVVGASYIALECAGLLQSVGFPCTVLARSVPLRLMDQQCARAVTDDMQTRVGVKILTGALPTKIEKDAATGKLRVEYRVKSNSSNNNNAAADEVVVEEFDTVVSAIGRQPTTRNLHLDNAGVRTAPSSGKIVANEFARTTAPHIYAVGDVVEGAPELQPVSVRAGTLLADRLFDNGPSRAAVATKTLDYALVPTVVFTPLEYGFVGHSEESAIATVAGGDASKIECYLRAFTPLEWALPHLPSNTCLMKLVCEKETDRVLGFHVVAPNAGEMLQGVALAFHAAGDKLTRQHFLDVVGLHPTCAEDMTQLTVAKSSGEEFGKVGC